MVTEQHIGQTLFVTKIGVSAQQKVLAVKPGGGCGHGTSCGLHLAYGRQWYADSVHHVLLHAEAWQLL